MGQNLYSSLSIFILGMIAASVAATAAPDFESQIAPIFEGHCLSCHNSTDAEGDFVLQTKADARSPYSAFYYYQRDQLQAIRSGSWKLFLPRETSYRHPHYTGTEIGPTEALLFNVVEDIGSENNLASEHPDIVARLSALAEVARADLGDTDRVGAGVRAIGQVANPTPRVKE